MNSLKAVVRKIVEIIVRISLNIPVYHGDKKRVFVGENVSLMNTLLNTASGDIRIGNNTIFGHNCMVLTGKHRFLNGKREKLITGQAETPVDGFDIYIGDGCWIASGAIVVGGVTIGNNVIVMAGAVVTKDVPSGHVVAGIPARVVGDVAS